MKKVTKQLLERLKELLVLDLAQTSNQPARASRTPSRTFSIPDCRAPTPPAFTNRNVRLCSSISMELSRKRRKRLCAPVAHQQPVRTCSNERLTSPMTTFYGSLLFVAQLGSLSSYRRPRWRRYGASCRFVRAFGEASTTQSSRYATISRHNGKSRLLIILPPPELTKGYLDFFEPDVFVESRSGLAARAQIENMDLDLGHSGIVSLDAFLTPSRTAEAKSHLVSEFLPCIRTCTTANSNSSDDTNKEWRCLKKARPPARSWKRPSVDSLSKDFFQRTRRPTSMHSIRCG